MYCSTRRASAPSNPMMTTRGVAAVAGNEAAAARTRAGIRRAAMRDLIEPPEKRTILGAGAWKDKRTQRRKAERRGDRFRVHRAGPHDPGTLHRQVQQRRGE